jgi:hypothetical protein
MPEVAPLSFSCCSFWAGRSRISLVLLPFRLRPSSLRALRADSWRCSAVSFLAVASPPSRAISLTVMGLLPWFLGEDMPEGITTYVPVRNGFSLWKLLDNAGCAVPRAPLCLPELRAPDRNCRRA